jgi:hypothetical protein
MNNSRTERDIKLLLSTQNTSEAFYPPSTKWIVCRNYTYIPHSNECGPRSLVAATILALHPNPSNYSLLPSMHSNLAQISRTWVAVSLLNNAICHPAVILLCAPSSSHFLRSTRLPSTPFHLIPWPALHQRPAISPVSPKQEEPNLHTKILQLYIRKPTTGNPSDISSKTQSKKDHPTKPSQHSNKVLSSIKKISTANPVAGPKIAHSRSSQPAKRQVQILPGQSLLSKYL